MKSQQEYTLASTTVQRLTVWALIVIGMLFIPFLTKAPWSTGDFVLAAALLFGSATVYELTTQRIQNPTQKFIVGAGVFGTLITVWVLLATA